MQATPEKKALWQQRIDAWHKSDLKQSVWCRQNGVKDYQFSYWKKKLSFHAEKEVQPKNTQPRLAKRTLPWAKSVSSMPLKQKLKSCRPLKNSLYDNKRVNTCLMTCTKG